MMTVKQVSELTGVSIRTLHYYDSIGLLCPSRTTAAGYRLYDDAALARLQDILLFRELKFSLAEIAAILSRPGFDRKQALSQQIELLTLQKERLEALIAFAKSLQQTGGKPMDFKAFDTSKQDEYARKAKERWGGTEAYKEFTQKTAGYDKARFGALGQALMDRFKGFAALSGKDPADEAVRAEVKALQDFITAHYYTCTDEILASLGQLYGAGGEFTENIDAWAGEGTAAFAARAIEEYLK